MVFFKMDTKNRTSYYGRHPSPGRYETLFECLKKTTFFGDPASSRFHCNYPGGLYEHSANVQNNLLQLTFRLRLDWADRESPLIIGLAHDVCKIGAYIPDGNGGYTRNPDQPPGHGDLSVARVLEWIDLTDEEKACIRWHMGAFDDKENWNAYNDAIHKFPNVLWTHTADMLATHVDEIERGV